MIPAITPIFVRDTKRRRISKGMTNILVTGATGTIGKETVRALASRGLSVRVGLREPGRAPAGVEAVRLDWADPSSFDGALAGIDRVFLLTPFIEDAETPARAFLAAAAKAKVSFLVKLSAAGVSEDAPFEAARQHARVEKALAGSGVPYAILRPTFFMDNVFTFQRESLVGEGAFHGASGDQPVAYISSRDLGEVAAALLAEPARHVGKTYDLTGGAALRGSELAELLGTALGKPIRYADHSIEDYAAGMRAHGAPNWMVEAMTTLETVKRNGWAQAISPAVTEILGRAPESYQAFLARTAPAMRG